MGRYNFAPQRVHQAATRLIDTTTKRFVKPGEKQPVAPPWYKVIGSIPPSERLVRPALQPAQRRGRKASKLFQPLRLEYEEDRLRLNFFGDHPWELARPRQVLEDDGKDYQKFDWSSLEQPTKATDGESVVQRQVWLMGQLRHEIDFPASHNLREYLRSLEFQEDLRLSFKNNHAVELDCCAIPEEKEIGDSVLDVPLTLQLTWHPKHPSQFKEGLKQLHAALTQHGLDIGAINKRAFRAAFPLNADAAQILQQADLSAIGKQYNIDIELESLAKVEDFEVQPVQFNFYRNATPQLPNLINHIATLLKVSPNDVLSSTLPTESPDTFKAYTKAGAYDKARKEFYDIRLAQEIERRVAIEEASWTGAEFGPGPLEVGLQLEDQKYEEWREWAGKEITLAKQLRAGSGGAGEVGIAEDDADVHAAMDELEPDVPGSQEGQTALGGAMVHP